MSSGDTPRNLRLVFHVSHVRVEVVTSLTAVARALIAVWGSARHPLVPTTETVCFWAGQTVLGYEIRAGSELMRIAHHPDDVLAMLESALYEAIARWHTDAALLHAACVAGPPGTLVFVGRSGAGKSSLAGAALARGYIYASDDLTVVRGDAVWGLPRALQYDVSELHSALPGWLAGADRAAYRLRDKTGELRALPVIRVAVEHVLRRPLPAADVTLIALERTSAPEPRLLRLDALETLCVLRQAQLNDSRAALALAARRGFRLYWHEPDAALSQLEARLRERAPLRSAPAG